MAATDPIRLEHSHLERGVESLRMAADHVGELPSHVVDREIREVLNFLMTQMLPHVRHEQRVVYPVVGRAMGAPSATLTMALDHEEVALLAGRLARAAEERDAHLMRRYLYGLYHVLTLHVKKEEQVYLPLLDANLSDQEARELFAPGHAA